MYKNSSHENLLHFGSQKSHLNTCYYYQDRRSTMLRQGPHLYNRRIALAPLHAQSSIRTYAGGIWCPVSAPSIFGASPFDR